MIPSFKPGIMSSNRILKATGGDVTPSNSFEFGYNSSGTGNVTSDLVTIAGIDTPITLRIEVILSDGYTEFSRYINSVQTTITSFPHSFTVSNGDSIFFEIQLETPGYVVLYDIYNESDGNALLSSNNGFEWVSGGG